MKVLRGFSLEGHFYFCSMSKSMSRSLSVHHSINNNNYKYAISLGGGATGDLKNDIKLIGLGTTFKIKIYASIYPLLLRLSYF